MSLRITLTLARKIKLVTLLGQKIYLDQIEHQLNRKKLRGPIAHLIVDCTLIICLSLLLKPMVANNVEQ
ncbi:MAG: hypothetical protein HN353_13580 [Bdellovibrionales bacterium]|mgnify:CR=1|jgi:hypothetical protein|nr:hypothetical protein [Bdellovibrionales bacterium]MBT3524876.1 hypothetical protein [Bdellovibrionales bacterium]MBT7670622.1 hypothetical protein [Bdellovibrionales bacterium]MBT7767510.1 hypothetical protein [Bdellovibrionales bacterium]